ncbi:MAG: hypothetical protein IIW86_02050 [Clostridia bacterium]|nr:hypothetical protein [Clostridia bacterium]
MTAPTTDSTKDAAAKMPLRSCRLQFQNPATFEVTAVYLTRTDAHKYRVKVFKGGKCQLAEYVEGDDFLDVFAKIEKKLYEN